MAKSKLQHVADDVSGDAEQPGMAERHKPGIANQNVQAEGEDREEKDLAGDIDVINAAHPIGQGAERHERDAKCEDARAHGTCLPNRPCGRRISTSSMGRNKTK